MLMLSAQRSTFDSLLHHIPEGEHPYTVTLVYSKREVVFLADVK